TAAEGEAGGQSECAPGTAPCEGAPPSAFGTFPRSAGEGADCAAALVAAAAPSASIRAMTVPSDTSSPALTLSSLTVPAADDGTSIVALSDSSVTRPWSFATVSPGLTSTSMTGTFV